MIENLGNIGELIGGIGVVITLIYLATQIRQNTRSLRLTSVQQIISTSVQINETASTGPIPEILSKLEMGGRLTEKEFAQYLMHLWASLTHFWQVFHQHENGMIDDVVFDVYMARLRINLSSSLARSMWRNRIRQGFPENFQKLVDTQIKNDIS